MFDRLVRVHGNLLVNHALGYLTVAKFGLTGTVIDQLLLLTFYWQFVYHLIASCDAKGIHSLRVSMKNLVPPSGSRPRSGVWI